MTIMDSFETEGLDTTCGAPALARYVPGSDAAAVARLRGAGAVVFGKTNVPLFAGDFQTCNEVYGLSRNPWDPGRTTGGSSGGAAAALAAGMTLLELGSDIWGSIRAPAHYNGVAGQKPTWGAVPTRGHIPRPPGSLAPIDLGVVGPLGRRVEDLALALSVLTAPDLAGVPGGALPPSAPATGSLRRLRVAAWADDPAAPTSREVSAAVRALADRMAAGGALVDELARPGPSLEEMTVVYVELLMGVLGGGYDASATERFQAVVDASPDGGGVALAQARGVVQRHQAWLAVDERRHQIMAGWERLFERVDVVIAPCAPGIAFPHDVAGPAATRSLDIDGRAVPYLRHLVWAGLATLPQLPATVVPVARSASGLPIGVQIVGPRWADRSTLAVGRLVEQLAGGFVSPFAPPAPMSAASR